MTPLLAAMLGTMGAAATTGVLLAIRRVEHAPAAVALVLLAAVSVARGPLNAALSPHPIEPWQGAARVLVYLDGALELGAASRSPRSASTSTSASYSPRSARPTPTATRVPLPPQS